MQAGITKPWLCLCDDDKKVVAKWLDTVPPKELVSEWVAGHLGKAFGLPVPGMRITSGLPELLRLLPQEDQGYPGDPDCPAFGSLFVQNAADLQFSALDSIDAKLKSDILIFDIWIRNDDRMLSDKGGNVNLLHRIDTKEIVVFDHNQAFDDNVDTATIIAKHVFSCDRMGIDLGDWVTRTEYEDRLECCYQQLDNIVAAMPPEWRQAANEQLMRSNRLKPGQDMIDDIIRPILVRHRDNEFWTEIRP